LITPVESYSFTPRLLAPEDRVPGVSAFMRIRNGADFLEATIRTHAATFDEIVAVYNQCDDATPEILARLAAEFGPKLRVYHYTPRVHPMGSEAHKTTSGADPSSLVTYSNFALAMTRHRWAVKLDDDHLAIPAAVEAMVRSIQTGAASEDLLHCFSGPNLMRRADGCLAIPAADPVSGGGDIGFFRVREDTHFVHDDRFERFARGPLRRHFSGWFYWHLKFLKSGGGFANYELHANAGSRFARKRERIQASALWSLPEARAALTPSMMRRLRAVVDAKAKLTIARDASFVATFPEESIAASLEATAPGWQRWLETGR
jgi:glycosyltransferase involved in cell wall biosynthesis